MSFRGLQWHAFDPSKRKELMVRPEFRGTLQRNPKTGDDDYLRPPHHNLTRTGPSLMLTVLVSSVGLWLWTDLIELQVRSKQAPQHNKYRM